MLLIHTGSPLTKLTVGHSQPRFPCVRHGSLATESQVNHTVVVEARRTARYRQKGLEIVAFLVRATAPKLHRIVKHSISYTYQSKKGSVG